MASIPDISVILPVYNERENLERLLEELNGAMLPMGRPFEIIAVNDGSTDGSAALLENLKIQYVQLKVIHFRRNFGQSAAFDAGFRNVSGSIIVTMDSDLQNDPRDIPKMISLLEEGYEFISGWRKDRKDPAVLRKIPSLIANWAIRKVTKTKVHDLGCSLKVYRKHIVEEIRLYGEMHGFLAPLAESAGASVAEFEVNHRARTAGESKYGLSRTVKVILDLLTVWFMRGYQTKPIYVFGTAGLASISAAVACAGIVLWDKLYLNVLVHNNPIFLLLIMFSLIGLQFLAIGLVAEIVVRIYFESRNKSGYLIADAAVVEAMTTHNKQKHFSTRTVTPTV